MKPDGSGRGMAVANSSYARRVRDCVQPTKLGYRSIVGQFRLSTMERIMTKIQALVVSAALAIGMAAPASAGVNDPEIIIYRFPGVLDNAGSGLVSGEATVFHCTNFSGVNENIRFVTREFDGTLKSNTPITVSHLRTGSIGTHLVLSYGQSGSLNTGKIDGGTTAIAATSINVICTAMVIDAGNFLPHGVALRGIRFSPVPGSQE